ncbi:zinc finger protein 555-like [Folsomia candida]|uniref:zinc finger protein 555-like n=1 Tax=Folsomia candida TaxID=158441 RepID=UPI001604E74E|nr:zinc finger protein 555-like [Folsomia candida]
MHKNGARFKCEVPGCGITLGARYLLNSHARTHSGKRPHACPHCSMTFLLSGNMRRHIRSKHMDDKVSRVFKCPLCPAKFKSAEVRARHEKTHLDESKRKNLACPHCSETFMHLATLKSHVRRFHTLPQDREHFPCSWSSCGAIFETSEAMRHHFRTRHTIRERKFKCYFCPKDFVCMDYLSIHVRVHTNEKPYSCSKCRKKFKSSGVKYQHLRDHHTTRIRFQCPHCEQRYLGKSSLETHMSKIHDPKSIKCGLCKLSLPSLEKLEIHIRAEHTNEKPYPCKICGLETSSYNLLRSHILQNHKDTVKHFKCRKCEKTSISRARIKNHEETHNPDRTRYPCPTCGTTYSNIHSLRDHVNAVHANVFKYSCYFCSAKYRFADGYKAHMRKMHTKEIPHRCKLCSFKSVNHGTLNGHVRFVHREATSCYFCRKMCSDMETHMTIHTTELHFGCGLCPKSFRLQGVRRTHRKKYHV